VSILGQIRIGMKDRSSGGIKERREKGSGDEV
jgi:hypothetical protein